MLTENIINIFTIWCFNTLTEF